MAEPMTRGTIQDLLAKFATENPQYREALLANPKKVIEEQLATSLPEGLEVKAIAESADTAYVVIPHVASEGELDDADLEKVAGGMLDKNVECDVTGLGAMNTFVQINL